MELGKYGHFQSSKAREKARESTMTKHMRMTMAFTGLLGKRGDDPDVKRAIAALRHKPEIDDDREHGGKFYIFKKKGLELLFEKGGRLTTVFLFSEGLYGNKQYTGPL